MATWLTTPRWLLTAGLLCWAAPACCADPEAYKKSVADLATSSRSADPEALAGIGQIYCKMKEYVGDAPLTTDNALAVLHWQHPETKPKSRKQGSVQAEVMNLAAQLLCPDTSPGSGNPQ